MQYLPEHPFAGSFEDPYDEFRFRSVLDREGALGVFHGENAEMLADALRIDVGELRKNAKEFVFCYKAPFGKTKSHSISFAVIPPRKPGPESSQVQNQAQE